MKRILFVFVAIVSASAFAQTPAQFAKNAEAFSEAAAAPVYVARESRGGPGWVKMQAKISDAKWDVKKTDSMLAPVVGKVTFSLHHGVSLGHATKEDAESAPPADWLFLDRVELEYVPTKTGWAFSSGRSFNNSVGQWVPVKPTPEFFTPSGWAIKGFSVEK